MQLTPLRPLSLGALLWRTTAGGWFLTTLAKATFQLVHRKDAELTTPLPLTQDIHHEHHPARTLYTASDAVPYKQRVDVLFVGNAYAPPGERVRERTVRLAMSTPDRVPILQKTLRVVGERSRAAGGEVEAEPVPFARMPLRYELAFGGPFHAENPIGVGADSSIARLPSILQPDIPEGVAGFAPMPPARPARVRLLGAHSPELLTKPTPVLPERMDWSYYQSAPRDQQVSGLRGDEWLELTGLHPVLAEMSSRLPGLRARVFLELPGGLAVEVRVVLDTVWVDGDGSRCTLTWRGVAPLATSSVATVDQGRITGTLEPIGESSVAEPSAPGDGLAPAPVALAEVQPRGLEAVAPDEIDLDGTTVSGTVMALDINAVGSATPFVPATEVPGAVAASLPPVNRAPAALTGTARALEVRRGPVLPFASGGEAPAPLPPAHPLPSFVFAGEVGQGGGSAPPRTTEHLPILNMTPFVVFTIPWQVRPPRDSITVVLKSTFVLPKGSGSLRLASTQELPHGDVTWDDDPAASLASASDFAIYKPKADVTLVGDVAPREASGTSAVVRFRFGDSFDRSLAVFGDRRWDAVGAQGKPARFSRIPLRYEHAFGGAGYADNPIGKGFDSRDLPNLEWPDARVVSRGASAKPAGFGPVAANWRPRQILLGTYDRAWTSARWPYFPLDFDYAHFNSAPREQQIEYPKGDERFAISALGPDREAIEGELPGIRPRVFGHQTAAAGARFFEVPIHLDTVSFDATSNQVVLVWRGVFEAQDEDATDVASLFVVAETGDGRLSMEQARAQFHAASAAARVADEDPETAPSASREPEDAALQRRLASVGAGRAGVSASASPDSARPAEPAPIPAMPRSEVVALLAARAPLLGLDLSGTDLGDLDLRGLDLSGAILSRSNLGGARLDGARLVEAVLDHASAEDASFTDADLSRADLTGASLGRARFDRANLTSAQLGGAQAPGAVFDKATLRGARFNDADLTKARFDEASAEKSEFMSAKLESASFVKAALADAKFYGASGVRVRMDGAGLADLRADDADFTRGSFRAVRGVASTWEGAKLEAANFESSVLARASFTRANLDNANLNQTDLREARFRKSHLVGTRFVKADLMQATFEGAVLTRADLRGANLYQAETWKAKLDGADLAQAFTKGTKL